MNKKQASEWYKRTIALLQAQNATMRNISRMEAAISDFVDGMPEFSDSEVIDKARKLFYKAFRTLENSL